MGLFSKKNKCEKRDIVFEPMEETNDFGIRNQDVEITENISKSDILKYIDIMLDDPDQFVVLSAPKPIENIEFVQAALAMGRIQLQIGVMETEAGSCKLYFKECTEEECKKSFLDFFHGNFQPDMKEYKPVKFM